jgi:hypothetical protein
MLRAVAAVAVLIAAATAPAGADTHITSRTLNGTT